MSVYGMEYDFWLLIGENIGQDWMPVNVNLMCAVCDFCTIGLMHASTRYFSVCGEYC
jgi:hypothetical protein